MDTPVFALAVPAPHQFLHPDDEDERVEVWHSANTPAVLLHIEALNSATAIRLRDLAPGYQSSPAPASGVSRWINHCNHCDGTLEDDELHCEPEAAFMPVSPKAAHRIRLTEVFHPLQVNAADSAPDATWLDYAARG
jgi:hypothetical protein